MKSAILKKELIPVVFDTNIWISGLLWRNLAWKLLRLAEQGQIQVCMAPTMLEELEQVLTYDKLQSRLNQLRLTSIDLITYVIDLVSMFEVILPPNGNPIVIADPDDDIFLHCAITAQVAYIISGDRHLLELEQYHNIPIVTIRHFLESEFPHLIS